MIKSMTGYGRGQSCKQGRNIIVEIKSVNHRYNDISIKLPRIMNSLEDGIRKTVSSHISRGKTDIYINYETIGDLDITINFNEVLADAYYNALIKIKERYNIEENIHLSAITRFPDVISTHKGIDCEGVMQELKETLDEATDKALKNFIAMREHEGAVLKSDIVDRLASIKALVSEIACRAPLTINSYKERLTQKLNEALSGIEIDQSRLLTEVTIFADKSCVDEEITRLSSHIEQMLSILDKKGPVGRKLDFLVQEMNRESNTIGSKSSDVEIIQTVVELKSEIEKIREQIQNIE